MRLFKMNLMVGGFLIIPGYMWWTGEQVECWAFVEASQNPFALYFPFLSLCKIFFAWFLFSYHGRKGLFMFSHVQNCGLVWRRVFYNALTFGEASFEFSSDEFCTDGTSKLESTPISAQKFKQLHILVFHSI